MAQVVGILVLFVSAYVLWKTYMRYPNRDIEFSKIRNTEGDVASKQRSEIIDEKDARQLRYILCVMMIAISVILMSL